MVDAGPEPTYEEIMRVPPPPPPPGHIHVHLRYIVGRKFRFTYEDMADVLVFVVAPEIVVWQKRSHHLTTPRNWAMESHQLPNQLNIFPATRRHQ